MRNKPAAHKRKSILIVLLTVIVAVALVIVVVSTIDDVNRKNSEYCFNDLDRAGRSLASELYEKASYDRNVLKAIATLLALNEAPAEQQIINAMNAFTFEDSYVNYVQALMPDNRLLCQDGTVIDAAGQLDFAAEAELGEHISGKVQGISDPSDHVVRSAVPVKKDGETICILYGVVSLSELSKVYTTDIYSGRAYVYLEDGDTGDFLLDTWHNTAGNIYDFKERVMLGGYDYEKSMEDMRQGRSGNIAFISQSTGKVLYLHYTPSGINNLNVVVSVTEDVAFARTSTVSTMLYKMAAFVGLIMLLYLGSIVVIMLSNYRAIHKMSIEDSTTQIKNRNAYEARSINARDDTFPTAACVYMDANGLHEINNKYGHAAGDKMLKTVADGLKSMFGYEDVYRVGGDEFVVLCINETREACMDKISAVHKYVEQCGYTISSGFAFRENEKGFDRIVREADACMGENKKVYYSEHERRRPR